MIQVKVFESNEQLVKAQIAADKEIADNWKTFDFDIREFPIELIYSKFIIGLEEDQAELFIPDYQREFVWSERQQSKFIESLLLNLPIPYIFVADIADGDREGRLEIVDGSQRIRTIVRFLNDDLILWDLKWLKSLDGFKFSTLSKATQRRLNRKTVRIIELLAHDDERVRREIFERINSGSKKLVDMETRYGVNDGPFLELIKRCAEVPLLHVLCPISPARRLRREYEELVLRYFAYSDRYESFNHDVGKFLDDYLIEMNKDDIDIEKKFEEFSNMLTFVAEYFDNGFKKNPTNSSVPRIRFEAISVGITLALRISSQIVPAPVSSWINSKDFIQHTRSDASNSRPKVKGRIEYVRDKILGNT